MISGRDDIDITNGNKGLDSHVEDMGIRTGCFPSTSSSSTLRHVRKRFAKVTRMHRFFGLKERSHITKHGSDGYNNGGNNAPATLAAKGSLGDLSDATVVTGPGCNETPLAAGEGASAATGDLPRQLVGALAIRQMDERLEAFDARRHANALSHLQGFRRLVGALLDRLDDDLASASASTGAVRRGKSTGVRPASAAVVSRAFRGGGAEEATAAGDAQWRRYLRRRRSDFCSDHTLLRYLRAMDSNQGAALDALRSTLEWRVAHIDPPALCKMRLQRWRHEKSLSYQRSHRGGECDRKSGESIVGAAGELNQKQNEAQDCLPPLTDHTGILRTSLVNSNFEAIDGSSSSGGSSSIARRPNLSGARKKSSPLLSSSESTAPLKCTLTDLAPYAQGIWDYYDDDLIFAPLEKDKFFGSMDANASANEAPSTATITSIFGGKSNTSSGGGGGDDDDADSGSSKSYRTSIAAATPVIYMSSEEVGTSPAGKPTPIRTPRRSLSKAFEGAASDESKSTKRNAPTRKGERGRAALDDWGGFGAAAAAPLASPQMPPQVPLPWTSSAPICQACHRDPTAHCFYRLGLDRVGRHVVYSCAGRARNKVVADNCTHMAFELERIFRHNSSTGKIVWVIDFKGFSIRDCSLSMCLTALPMFSKHYPERMGQIVLLDPNVFFYGLWLGIQSVLDPVTKSKVVMLRGEAAREAYADVQWRGAPDPAMADWICSVAKLNGSPGIFPETMVGDLRDPVTCATLEHVNFICGRCRD